MGPWKISKYVLEEKNMQSGLCIVERGETTDDQTVKKGSDVSDLHNCLRPCDAQTLLLLRNIIGSITIPQPRPILMSMAHVIIKDGQETCDLG